MQQDLQWQPRNRVPVALRTRDGEALQGYVFVPSDMRISDLLDTSRRFLPFVDRDGEFSLIAKSAILRLIPDDAQARASRGQGGTPAQTRCEPASDAGLTRWKEGREDRPPRPGRDDRFPPISRYQPRSARTSPGCSAATTLPYTLATLPSASIR